MHTFKKTLSLLTVGAVLASSVALTSATFTASADAEFIFEDGTITGVIGELEGDVVVPETIDDVAVTAIGDEAFYDQDEMTSITLPDTVTTIGEEAFSECLQLATISVGEGLVTIGDYAFAYCHALTSIALPVTVVEIGDGAFCGCTSLTGIEIPEEDSAFATVDGVLFDKEMATLIDYPCGIEATEYAIPEGVETIAPSAFEFCNNLVTVTMPDSVVTIGDSAFYDCVNLTNVTFGAGLVTIEDYAFNTCVSLAAVSLPASLAYVGEGAFNNCHSVTVYDVAPENEMFASVDGVAFNKDMTLLIDYPCGSEATTYEIPETVTEIGDYAFGFCMGLTSITIPDSVVEIGRNAFYCCGNLTELTLGAGVTAIDDYAFEGCESLTEITIPENVEEIDFEAFTGCVSLKKLTILNPEVNIYEDAFTFTKSCTIYGYTESTAHDYATTYGYKFIPLDGELALGDIDGDGEITAIDAQYVLVAYAASNVDESGSTGLSDVEFAAADVDGDGVVTAIDAHYILVYYATSNITEDGTANWDDILKK